MVFWRSIRDSGGRGKITGDKRYLQPWSHTGPASRPGSLVPRRRGSWGRSQGKDARLPLFSRGAAGRGGHGCPQGGPPPGPLQALSPARWGSAVRSEASPATHELGDSWQDPSLAGRQRGQAQGLAGEALPETRKEACRDS